MRSEELRVAARTLNSTAIHLLRAMRPLDRTSGLTDARLSALSVLVFSGPRPLGRLAAEDGVSSPTMTRIVDGLVGLGLAERRTHPENGRIVTVAATPTGIALMEKASQRRVVAIAQALGELPAKDLSAVIGALPAWPEVVRHVRRTVQLELSTEGSDRATEAEPASQKSSSSQETSTR